MKIDGLNRREITPAHNKNYMSIGVSVRTTKFAARKSGIGVRQESNPQTPTVYSSVRCASYKKSHRTLGTFGFADTQAKP